MLTKIYKSLEIFQRNISLETIQDSTNYPNIVLNAALNVKKKSLIISRVVNLEFDFFKDMLFTKRTIKIFVFEKSNQ